MNNNIKILFIAGRSYWSYQAFEFLKKHFREVESIFWNHDDPQLPLINWSGQWIISFKSRFILSKKDLSLATKGTINFHPAPPYYRGIGGYVYSLFNDDDCYGVTCHHMAENVDEGQIVKVNYFDLNKSATASALKELAAKHCFDLFCEIVRYIISGKNLPISNEIWGEKFYKHKQLDRFIDDLKSKNIQHNCLI